MSTEVKAKATKGSKATKPTERKRILRKATFLATESKGKTVFRAVNKRAHKLCVKMGKRSVLDTDTFKAAKALKRYKVYVYAADGTLKVSR